MTQKDPSHHHSKRYRSKGYLAERYDVDERTLDRWCQLEKFPKPDLRTPSGAPRWSDELIEAHERALVGKQESA
jgi:hypothetical protein